MKASLEVKINGAGAAFGATESEAVAEVVTILQKALAHIEDGTQWKKLLDSNGNWVGEFCLTITDDAPKTRPTVRWPPINADAEHPHSDADPGL